MRRRDRQGFEEISVGFGERERRAHCVVPMLNPKPLMERERERERCVLGTLWELVENKHPACSYYQRLRATSHTRLRARDHYTSSTLIGGKGGAGPSSLHTTLEGPTEYVNAR